MIVFWILNVLMICQLADGHTPLLCVVKNPVDHPHGGGEGKSAGGRHPVSRTGQSAKGLKTRDE